MRHERQKVFNREICTLQMCKSSHQTLYLYETEGIYGQKDQMQDHHRIDVRPSAECSEQNIADERDDPERDHGGHAERCKHRR